jgi:hypothetical protein
VLSSRDGDSARSFVRFSLLSPLSLFCLFIIYRPLLPPFIPSLSLLLLLLPPFPLLSSTSLTIDLSLLSVALFHLYPDSGKGSLAPLLISPIFYLSSTFFLFFCLLLSFCLNPHPLSFCLNPHPLEHLIITSFLDYFIFFLFFYIQFFFATKINILFSIFALSSCLCLLGSFLLP